MKGKFIVITGPSASGKTSTVNALLKEIPNSARLVTTTTRAPRQNEKEGVDYHFISREEFESGLKKDEFFEHAEVYGNLYGSAKKVVGDMRKKFNYVFAIIDVQGARTLKEKIPDCKVFFLKPGSFDDILKRLNQERAETPKAEMERRVKTTEHELSLAASFDGIIENIEGRFTDTVASMKAVLAALP